MRTTINMPDSLLAQAKKAALDAGATLTEFITDAVRLALSRKKVRSDLGPMPVYKATPGQEGLQPGVDLTDTAAVLDLLDEADAADRR
jgi:hypothetical protein